MVNEIPIYHSNITNTAPICYEYEDWRMILNYAGFVSFCFQLLRLTKGYEKRWII